MSNVMTNIRLVAVLAVLTLEACTHENFTTSADPTYEGELVETFLSLLVAGVKIIGTPMNTESTRSALATQNRTTSFLPTVRAKLFSTSCSVPMKTAYSTP